MIEKSIPSVGLIVNVNRDAGLSFAKETADWLLSRGCAVYAETGTAECLRLPPLTTDALYRAADFLVCLGGDGTILRASQNAWYNKPLLGVNLGRLGYLTDAERQNAFTALDCALNGQYKTEKRMMLEAVTGAHSLLALNDFCVTRGAVSRLIEFELYVNDETIDTYRADGVIICTPTGSTAYNLSAGGPILKPDVEMIAVTPICAHMLYARALVLSAEDVVRLRIAARCPDACALSLDGRHVTDLRAGDEVVIRRSPLYTNIIKTNPMSFFELLHSKMVGGAENARSEP